MTGRYKQDLMESRNSEFERDETISILSLSNDEDEDESDPKKNPAIFAEGRPGLLTNSSQDLDSTARSDRRRLRSWRRKCTARRSQFTVWQRRHGFTGWRFSVTLSAVMCLLIFLINFAFLISVIARGSVADGIATLHQGSCSTAANTSTTIHIAINILSSLLLGSSNFCMQCLIAPSRSEVDQAHANGRSLDIGVSSIRNLKWIHWQRILVWSILAVSSLPLHLFYNSVVFTTLGANQYDAIVFPETSFQTGPQSPPFFSYEEQGANEVALSGGPSYPFTIFSQSTALFQNLTVPECMNMYGSSGYVTTVSNVLVVSSALINVSYDGTSSPLLRLEPSDKLDLNGTYIGGFNNINRNTPQYWIWTNGTCQDFAACADFWPVLTTVTSEGNRSALVSYCLAQVTTEACQLQISVHLLTIVLVCNALKLGCFLTTVWKLGQDTFMVVGDALASYLENPDAITTGNCLASKNRGPFSRKKRTKEVWIPQRRFWWKAPRLVLCLLWVILCTICLALVLYLYVAGIYDTNYQSTESLKGQWSLGFGRVSALSLVDISGEGSAEGVTGTTGLIAMVLLANTPQLIVSALYVIYNNLFTAMLLAREWSEYAHRRRYLRVTSPRDNQRSTYYLHLPYRYGFPLMTSMIILHWLISQSLFLVRIKIIGDAYNEEPTLSQVGYSLIAILFSIFAGSSMILALIGLGFRRFSSGIPLAASDSAAISAACHPPKDDVGASKKRVMWGEVLETVDESEPGHCTFTSKDVHAPVQGRQYK